jgi:hypothetical protein
MAELVLLEWDIRTPCMVTFAVKAGAPLVITNEKRTGSKSRESENIDSAWCVTI